MRGLSLLCAASLLTLTGCDLFHHRAHQPDVATHYLIGRPYQVAGVWHYPREQFDYDETGLATVTATTRGITSDGEAASATAMAGAHATLQLPAIVLVTNLDNGLQVKVRLNDRGPADPGRVIALTPRAMALLGAGNGAAPRVRVQVLEAESRRLAGDLNGTAAPPVQIAAAPATAVGQQSLAPPPGAAQSGQVRIAAPLLPVAQHSTTAVADSAPMPLRLPEVVTRTAPVPGSLYVEIATFSHPQMAEVMADRLAALGARATANYSAPPERAYTVRIGPLSGVAAADAALARAFRAGVAEARIVSE